jgi:hypothetical protein
MFKQTAVKLLPLDDDIDPRMEMFNFSSKNIIFDYQGEWYYSFGGILKHPTSTAKYGVSHFDKSTGEEVWAVSKDILKLIQWKQEQQKKDEDNG